MITKILKDVLTNADGITYCHARVSGAVTTVIYWGMGMWTVISTHTFEPVQFATGYAAILAAVCGGAWMKKDTENS